MARSYTYRELATLAGAYTNGETKTSDVVNCEAFSRARVSVSISAASAAKVALTIFGATSNDSAAVWIQLGQIANVTVNTGDTVTLLVESPSKFVKATCLVSSAVATLGNARLEFSTEA